MFVNVLKGPTNYTMIVCKMLNPEENMGMWFYQGLSHVLYTILKTSNKGHPEVERNHRSPRDLNTHTAVLHSDITFYGRTCEWSLNVCFQGFKKNVYLKSVQICESLFASCFKSKRRLGTTFTLSWKMM